MAALDGGRAGHGLGAQVAAVAALGRAVDDAAVQLAARGRGAEGRRVVRGSRLVRLGRDLGRERHCVGVGLDADGLFVFESVYIVLVEWAG